jgi:hypothetical protein
MKNLRHAVIATIALVTGGFLVGGLVGAISSAIFYFPANGWGILTAGGGGALVLRNALIVGTITGVATPLLAWIGLRRIAIGRVIALGALGAAGGALAAALLLGPILPARLWGLTSPIMGAVAGSVMVGTLLRLTIRARRSETAEQAV